jgi:glycolate oxidase
VTSHRRRPVEGGTGGAPLRATRRNPTPAEAALLRDLRSGLAAGQVLTAAEDLVCYGFDAAADSVPGRPVAVVFPRSTAEVSHVVQAAARHHRPIFTRGAGTNLSGGSTPTDGGVVLCLLEMHEILEIDAVNLTATVQPGVIIKELDEAAAAHGLMYPPDPGSVATATMGGSVAECAGGLRGLKYGVTKDYVTGLEVVLADGRVLRSGGKTVKNVTGYDLVKLMVGSEGTLGVITEIVVRLRPRPEAMRSMVSYFHSQRAAADTAIAIVGAGVIPATLEFMDHTTIVAVEAYTHVGLQVEADALLLIEVDGIPEMVAREAEAVLAQCRDHGGDVREVSPGAERDALWTARRAALPATARLRPTTIVEDATVPRSQIAAMLELVAEVARKHDVTISVVGHAGDGNLHPTILTDKSDPAEMERVHAAIDEIFAGALRLGGTLSGEHGIGTSKQRYLPWEIGDVGVEISQRIKRALDPQDLLNPGKVVTLAGSAG